MFSPRNIHFIILGIILGATSGYIFAFYQVQSSTPPPMAENTRMPQDHPDVTRDQMMALFKEALEKSPQDTALLTRYGNFLFTVEDFPGAVDAYQKVLSIEPGNQNVRTDMGTALWNLGDRARALAEYEKSLEIDPKHMNTLHTLFLVQVEGRHDLQAAAEMLRRMEEADPKYASLPELRRQLEAERAKPSR